MNLKDSLSKSFPSRKRKLRDETEELEKLKKETEFEKGDFLALAIAALVTIGPVVIVVLALYYWATMFLFR